jgi:hypothetical protein
MRWSRRSALMEGVPGLLGVIQRALRRLSLCSPDITAPTETDVTTTTDVALRIRRLDGPMASMSRRPHGHRPNGPLAATPKPYALPPPEHTLPPPTESTPFGTTAFSELRPGCRTTR